MQKPIVHISKNPNPVTGIKSKYVIYTDPATLDAHRVVLDEATEKAWADITDVTFGRMKYTQRKATQEDVDSGAAKEVGKMIKGDWFRFEITAYQRHSDAVKDIMRKNELEEVTSRKLTVKQLKELADQVGAEFE